MGGLALTDMPGGGGGGCGKDIGGLLLPGAPQGCCCGIPEFCVPLMLQLYTVFS
jgi:hypothetical protein